MSANPQGQHIPLGMPDTATIACKNCKEQITVKMPAPVLLNSAKFNIFMLLHEIPDQCPKCGTIYAITTAGMQVAQTEVGPCVVLPLTWVELKSQGSVITPGTDDTLRSALAMNEIGSKMKQ